MPLDFQKVISPPIQPIRKPELVLNQMIDNYIRQWTYCFQTEAVTKIQNMVAHMQRDENLAAIAANAHRLRRQAHRPQDHEVLSIENYSPIVCSCLRAGFTLEFESSGRPTIATIQQPERNDWGFNAERLKAKAITLNWHDRELVDMLRTGASDYSPNKPPLSWFAPHRTSVFKHWEEFEKNMNKKEIRMGCIRGTWDCPPTVPFRSVPGTALTKPRRHYQYRIIWNESVPGPKSRQSIVSKGNEISAPVSTNVAAELPSYLAMAWISIDIVGHALDILATAAAATRETIQGRGRGFAHWFKMLRFAETELLKACVYFRGKFYKDYREQMGRVGSAHFGQRASALIAADAMRRSNHILQEYRNGDTLSPTLKRWINDRAYLQPIKQRLPLILLIFQDNLLEIAVGSSAPVIIESVERNFIKGELEVEFSPKQKANRRFATTFEFIGAEFDTYNSKNIKRRLEPHVSITLEDKFN